jgi:hypothetical protein
LGHWIGLVVPRLCDPVLAVRRAAVECIEQMLFVNHVLRVTHQKPGLVVAEIEHPDDLLPMFDIRDKIETTVLNEQFQLVHDVAQVLCKVVVADDLAELILSSLPGESARLFPLGDAHPGLQGCGTRNSTPARVYACTSMPSRRRAVVSSRTPSPIWWTA